MTEAPTGAGGFSAATAGRGPSAAYARGAIGHLKDELRGRTRVLDLRCGTGRLAGQLVRAGVDVVCVDDDASLLGQLARALPAAPAVLSSTSELSFPEATFEAVVIGAGRRALEIDGLMVEAGRVLTGTGVLAVVSNRDGDDGAPGPLAGPDGSSAPEVHVFAHPGLSSAERVTELRLWRRA